MELPEDVNSGDKFAWTLVAALVFYTIVSWFHITSSVDAICDGLGEISKFVNDNAEDGS